MLNVAHTRAVTHVARQIALSFMQSEHPRDRTVSWLCLASVPMKCDVRVVQVDERHEAPHFRSKDGIEDEK